MDKEVARMIVNTALRVGADLTKLAPLLKQFGSGDVDQSTKMAIGSAIAEIGEIQARVFEQYPDLKAEAEARLNTYERSYY